MKAWFVKWRISTALDAGRSPWAWLRHWAGRSKELRTIEPELVALDRELRRTVPEPDAPASLHRSIMAAVRASGAPAATRPMPAAVRWLPAPALLAVGLLVSWFVLHRPAAPPVSGAPGLDAAAAALVTGGQIAQAAPAAVVAPLSDELERLNKDLQNTAQFLLASVP
jgi:hypothetical protein